MNQSPAPVYCGLDIAKDSLQVDLNGQAQVVANTTPARQTLLQQLKLHPGLHIICEATGGWERDLVADLHAAGLPVSVVNPAWVRHFAKAQGRLAKTDRLDAAILRAYGQTFHPKPTPMLSPQQKQLTELVARRTQVLDLVVMEKNRSKLHFSTAVRKLSQQLLRQLQRQVEQLDHLLRQLVSQDEALSQQVERLDKITGVGFLTAVSVLAHMPELGQLNRRQAAALAGVAPMNRESGPWNGQRFTGGGRASLRSALYMAAISACRANKTLKPFYQRLRQKGKPAKVALIAVTRKLIILMNQLLKNPKFVLAS